MHYLLFEQQARLTDFDLRKYALHVGSDPDLATGDAAQAYAAKVSADYAAGLECGVAGTPTLFINGEAYLGRVELNALQKATGDVRPSRASSMAAGVAPSVPRRPQASTAASGHP